MASGYLRSRYVFKSRLKRLLAFFFDLLGSCFVKLARSFKKSQTDFHLDRILLIRLDHLGDVVMIKPSIRLLAKKFPGLKIDLLISEEVKPLFQDDPDLHEIITMKHGWFSNSPPAKILSESQVILTTLKKNAYNTAIDFRGDLRNIFLMALAGIPRRIGYGITGGGFLLTDQGRYQPETHQTGLNQQLLKFLEIDEQIVEQKPFQYSPERKRLFWNQWSNRFKDIHPRIVIHPGAGYPSKRWQGSKFHELILKILRDEVAQIILIGTENEKTLLPPLTKNSELLVDLRGKTKLEELPILFDSCDLYLGNDSGPAHVAAAQGIEMIVLFSGTNDSKVWRPWSDKLHLIEEKVPCSPCESRICPLQHHDCMNHISVDSVLKLMVNILKTR